MKLIFFASWLTVGLCQIFGGWHTQDPTDPEYPKLVESLKSQQLTTIPTGFTLKSVQTQVVAGVNTKLVFEHNGATCEIYYFEQAWSNTHKITLDTCKTLASLQTRSGSYEEQDASDQQWAVLLNKLTADYNLVGLSNANGYKILKVETQVVAGINYKYTLQVGGHVCQIVYYRAVGDNMSSITKNTCNMKSTHTRLATHTCNLHADLIATQGHPMGGWSAQDPSDQQYQNILQSLETKYQVIDLPKTTVGWQIVAVQQQVVSGYKYGFTLKVNGRQCELVAWIQSWTNHGEILCDTCGIKISAHGNRRVGGWTAQDPSDQQWYTLLQKLSNTDHLVDLSGFSHYHVVSVETQLVAGTNYHFTLRTDGMPHQTCEIVYYHALGDNHSRISKDTCSNMVHRKGKAAQTCNLHNNLLATHGHPMPGGWAPHDPSDQHYDDLLNALDTKYNLVNLPKTNGGWKIIGLQTQVVAGENIGYTLQFNDRVCELKVFVQVWTNTRQITCDSCGIKVTSKRQLGGGGGGYSEVDHSQWVPLLKSLDDTLHLHLSDNNDLQVVDVKQQVVAGINYKFSFRTTGGKMCEMVYFKQAWTNTDRITTDTCKLAQKHKRMIDSTVATQQCMGAILDRINSMSNDMFRLVDNHIIQSSAQSTNNEMNYAIKVQLTESQCMNGQGSMGKTSTTGCAANPTSPIHNVWEAKCKYSANGIPIEVSGLNMVA